MRNIFIIIFLFIATLVQAQTTYYVAPDGSGNNGDDGSIGNPWATLAYGVANAGSGNIVYAQVGTHTVGSQISVPTGVSITGAGATSIVSSTVSTAAQTTFRLSSASENTDGSQSISYIKMDGNALTAWSAIMVLSRGNVEIHHCEFIDFGNAGIFFNGLQNIYLGPPTDYCSGNKFYNNQVDNCASYPDGDGQGEVMIGGQIGIEIYNNTMNSVSRAGRNNGYNIKFCGYGHNEAYKIYNNTLNRTYLSPTGTYFDFSIETWHTEGGAEIYDNVMTGGIDFGGAHGGYPYCVTANGYDYGAWVHDNTIGPASNPGGETTGIYIEWNSDGVLAERNHFINFNNGIMVSPGNGQTTKDHVFRYNIFENMAYYGFRFINGQSGAFADNIDIYNNVFEATGSALVGIGLMSVGTTTDIEVINNIVVGFTYASMYANGASGQTMDELKIQNNLMYDNASGNAPVFSNITPTNYTYSDNVLGDNPDFTNQGAGDFTLTVGSPAIDVGLELGLTTDFLEYSVPYNSIPDIGAYEYGAGVGIPVTSITVTGTATITIDDGTSQLSWYADPSDATDTTVVWSGVNGTGEGSISVDGLVTAGVDGSYTATATAHDGSGEYDDPDNDILNQVNPVLVTNITVFGAGDATTIETIGGTLQMSYTADPADATDTTIVWSKVNGTGTGTLDEDGLLTAATDGTVTVTATATDGSGVFDDQIITFSNQSDATTPVLSTALASYTAVTANLSGNITSNGGAAVTARGICYDTSTSPTTSDDIVPSSSGVGVYSCTIRKLSNSTTYYTRAYATNTEGTSYGNEITFTTPLSSGVLISNTGVVRGGKLIIVD